MNTTFTNAKKSHGLSFRPDIIEASVIKKTRQSDNTQIGDQHYLNAKKRKNKKKEKEINKKVSFTQLEANLFKDLSTVDLAPVKARKPTQELLEDNTSSDNENKPPERNNVIDTHNSLFLYTEKNNGRQRRAISALVDGSNLFQERDRPVEAKITRNQIIPVLKKVVVLLDEDSDRGINFGRIKLPINRSVQHSCPLSPSYGQRKPGSVEIQPNSGVFVEQAELQFYARWVDRPGEIVRRLMLNIVGEMNLKSMTALGKGKRRGIPPHVFEAVKYFVDETIGYEISFSDYVQILNQQCNTLRHPHEK